MKGSDFFLSIAVGLALSIFILSMVYTHDFGSYLKDSWSKSSLSAAQTLSANTHTNTHNTNTPSPLLRASAPAVNSFDRPAVIETVKAQRAFPNQRGVASSADFAQLMQLASTQPDFSPQRRQKKQQQPKEDKKNGKDDKPKKRNENDNKNSNNDNNNNNNKNIKKKKKNMRNAEESSDISSPSHSKQHISSNGEPMTCKETIEPTCKIYSYLRFWNHRFSPADCVQSPLRHPLKERAPLHEQKYLVFEPDRGGWNNIRMAAETAIIFAHATGRTLVLPPAARWYLLDKSKNQTDNISTFSKFFDLRRLKESMTMITMEDFLEKVAKIPGFLKKPLPAREDINKFLEGNKQPLWDYLGEACYTEEWEPGKQFIGFNISANNPQIFGEFDTDKSRNLRYRTMVAHGRRLRPYDEELHNEPAIYFPGDYRNTHRILTHFYTYLFWADPHEERVYRRLVRDRLHYHDSVFCAASQLVHAIHADASILTGKPMPSEEDADKLTLGGNTNKGATYFAMHIRRGDFQYKETKMAAQEIVDNTFHLLDPKVTKLLYIATDEQDKAFFEPFMRGPFTVKFLKDYLHEDRMKQAVPDFSANHIGMIEQVVCANAHTFIGTPFSTFTGYITRMRGYYRDGRYERTFYSMESVEKQLQKQRPIVGPFWAREFETAHKDIDDYIGN